MIAHFSIKEWFFHYWYLRYSRCFAINFFYHQYITHVLGVDSRSTFIIQMSAFFLPLIAIKSRRVGIHFYKTYMSMVYKPTPTHINGCPFPFDRLFDGLFNLCWTRVLRERISRLAKKISHKIIILRQFISSVFHKSLVN